MSAVFCKTHYSVLRGLSQLLETRGCNVAKFRFSDPRTFARNNRFFTTTNTLRTLDRVFENLQYPDSSDKHWRVMITLNVRTLFDHYQHEYPQHKDFLNMAKKHFVSFANKEVPDNRFVDRIVDEFLNTCPSNDNDNDNDKDKEERRILLIKILDESLEIDDIAFEYNI